MPLMALWSSNPGTVGEFIIEQVVATAGDGNLRDESACSQELRAYLAQAPSEKLGPYIQHCLTSSFSKSGMVLQDLVNELGRRLDFAVTNGRYQGTTNAVGFDGIWRSPEQQTIIVEIKTTDAYRISLDTVAGYRDKLAASGLINGPNSILVVVGRQDTGELEAQVRGSRHAWDIRLISAEALIKLVQLKENSDDPETGRKIRALLTPFEYTRLDRLIETMFKAATDIEQMVESDGPGEDEEDKEPAGALTEKGVWQFTASNLLNEKRARMIAAVGHQLGRC
jgi:hypothetical protein